MKTLVNVARYHLVDRITYVALPWGILAFSFLINVAIAAMAPNQPLGGIKTGGLVSIYVFLLVCGVVSMTRELPFGLMLGVSRRGYYLGTALLVLALGIAYGLALTVLQVLERASGGWGFSLHYFRVPWIMDGPWYPDLGHLVRPAGALLPVRHVVRAGVPAVGSARAGHVRRRPDAGGARGRGRGDADAPLDRVRALLHHGAGARTDRRAGRAHPRPGARRVHHHAPGHRLRDNIRHCTGVARRLPPRHADCFLQGRPGAIRCWPDPAAPASRPCSRSRLGRCPCPHALLPARRNSRRSR